MSLLAVALAVLLVAALVKPVTADAEVARTSSLVIPPPGGMTVGKAGNSDIDAVARDSPFAVNSIWAFDIHTQRFVSHVPGAPSFVNTIPPGEFSAETIVWLKRNASDRADDDVAVGSSDSPPSAANMLPVPALGGRTVGVAGTDSLHTLISAQRFQVASVWIFEVEAQEYRVHVVGAPAFVSDLDISATLEPAAIVWLHRSRADSTPVTTAIGMRLATAAPSPVSAASGPPAQGATPSTFPSVPATPASTGAAAPSPTPASVASPAPSGAGVKDCESVPENRLNLLRERVGFGAKASGGAEGCLYRVTNLDDSGPGSLREGAERGARWIVFDVSGTIELSSSIAVASNTTIDGRGADVTIRQHGLYVLEEQNVIISHVELRTMTDDGIQIRRQSTRDVWVNHVTVSDVRDGYLDITQGATNVTVSWSRFDPSPNQEREKTMLIGANDPGDRDDLTRVTLHHNFFNNTQQRNPLLRGGYVHSFNNYITGWGIYGSGVGEGGRLVSEGNVYEYLASHRERAFTPWDGGSSYIRSTGDMFLGGASGKESNADSVSAPPYSYDIGLADNLLRSAVRIGAGTP